LWLTGALGALLVGGCAHNEKSDTAMLGQLPMEQKQEVFTAQNNVQVATANQQSAQRAVDEAKTFDDVAGKQLDAAKTRLDAANKALSMGQKSQNPQTIQEGQANLTVAQREVAAFQAKKNYADRLVDLREKQADLASAELDRANIDQSIARVQSLDRAGMRPHEDLQSLVKDRQDKLADIASLQGRVSALEQQVNQNRMAWVQQRHSYNVAARTFTPPPINAPRGPQFVPERRVPQIEQAPVQQYRQQQQFQQQQFPGQQQPGGETETPMQQP
jgi:hypothetical protein